MRIHERCIQPVSAHRPGLVVPSLLVGLALPWLLVIASTTGRAARMAAPVGGARGAAGRALFRPELFRIELKPTSVSGSGSGLAVLNMAPSPFGISLTGDGHTRYDVRLTVQGLPAPATLGPYTRYVAWVATENLSPVRRLGVVRAGVPVLGVVEYHKFIILVSAEKTAGSTHWGGPVVLRGFSPSMYLDNFSGKEMFNGGVPQ